MNYFFTDNRQLSVTILSLFLVLVLAQFLVAHA
jgi:hypothetical protein